MKSQKVQRINLIRWFGMFLAIGVLAAWLVLSLTSSIARAAQQQPTSTPTPAQIPILGLTKTRELVGDLNDNALPDPGDTIEYIISIKNGGEAIAVGLKIEDDYDELLFSPLTVIGNDGTDDGDIITWEIEMLAAGEEITISYNATLNTQFSEGTTTVENMVTLTVSNAGVEPVISKNTFSVVVASPTPPLSPSPTVDMTPTVVPPDVGVITGTSGNINIDADQYVTLINYLLILFTVGLILLAIVFYLPKQGGEGGDQDADKYKDSQNTFLIAYIFAGVMATIVVLGIGGVIPHSTIAGLIGTIAGYLLRGAQK